MNAFLFQKKWEMWLQSTLRYTKMLFLKSFECIYHNLSISRKMVLIFKYYFWKDRIFDLTSRSILWSYSLIWKQALWGNSVFQVVGGRAACHCVVTSSQAALTNAGRRWENCSFLKCYKDCNIYYQSPVVYIWNHLRVPWQA